MTGHGGPDPQQRADVERFRDVIAARLGFRFDDDKLDELDGVLHARMRATGCTRPPHYLARLIAPDTAASELRALAESICVGETYFFRNPSHFQVMAEVVLPGRSRPPRILSAGCSTGEEAYSLAILLREHGLLPVGEARHPSIRGIDVNPAALALARAAVYSSWALRATAPHLLSAYFRPVGAHFALHGDIRAAASFEERNLLDDDPGFWHEGAFDVIFLRNVLIYLTPEAARAVIGRIHRALSPGGYLFLSPSETLRGLTHDFHLRHTHETFYYQRDDGMTPREPAAPPRLDSGWFTTIGRASTRISLLLSGTAQGLSPTAPTAPTHRAPTLPTLPTLDDGQRSAAPPAGQAGEPIADAPQQAPDLLRVMELLGEQRVDEAGRILAAMQAPDADQQLVLAAVLSHQGQFAAAAALCQRVLEIDEFNAGAYYLIARCCEHAGDPTAAIEHDRVALYLRPSFALPCLHLGLLHRRRGDIAAARRELTRALSLLAREHASQLLLFGGGQSREALTALCQAELDACPGDGTP